MTGPGAQADEQLAGPQKKRRHRTRKRRARRQSFAAPDEEADHDATLRSDPNPDLLDVPGPSRPNFYRLGQSGRNLSSTSLESEALLDHRYGSVCRSERWPSSVDEQD